MPKPPKRIDDISTELLPQGYDAGSTSGTMDEKKHIHNNVKSKKPGIGSESNAYKVPPGKRDGEG